MRHGIAEGFQFLVGRFHLRVELLHLFFRLLALGDVFRDAQQIERLSLFIVERDFLCVQNPRAAAPGLDRLFRNIDEVARSEHLPVFGDE